MPIYSYRCTDCGDFDAWGALSNSAAPADCPQCGDTAPRLLIAPRLRGLDRAATIAHDTNERSRHEPRRHVAGQHGPGCGCCSGPARSPNQTKPRMKSPGGGRPWMISH